MRVIKNAYLHLSTGLLPTKVLKDGLPLFKHVDMWFEQTEMIGEDNRPMEEYPFDFPACFMDFEIFDSINIGKLQDDVSTYVKFYVAFTNMNDTHATSEEKLLGLEFLENMSLLHEQIQGYIHPDVGTLVRKSMRRYKTISSLYIYELIYTTVMRDGSPQDARRATETITVDAEPKIDKYPHKNPNNNGDNGTYYDLS